MTREEAIKWLKHCAKTDCDDCAYEIQSTEWCSEKMAYCVSVLEEALTEPKWRTDGHPRRMGGTYMVTLDAFGHHRFVDLMCYGKPLMPNREVKGKCWYRSDDEWGDVVYDDEDILAWMPLPKPYDERRKP